GDAAPAPPWWVAYGPGDDAPATDAEAARFLIQATFGANAPEIAGLRYAGYAAWFDHQRALPASLELPYLQKLDADGKDVYQNQRQEIWWHRAVKAPDQLRQRLAFALSELFVVSDNSGNLADEPFGLASYYDVLATHALGNYRELLEAVTLHPAMGRYLSMLKNEKPNPAQNLRPDENYAREVMQLFTIGLVELAPDGTPLVDGFGDPLPTYDQTDVEELARVLTGWNYAGATSWKWPQSNWKPMEPWESYHDQDAKTIVGGAFVPAGQGAVADLEQALDVLFQHPNTGPFVATRLIQRLVTSNPTPGYVARVAAVFADDGTGERGDLFEVARAILEDAEAREGHLSMPSTFGKLKEPLLRQSALWRAFRAAPAVGPYEDWNPQSAFGQAALRAPSVFNFFQPSYSPPGALGDAGLLGPEFQITTHTFVTATTNRLYDRIFFAWPGYSGLDPDTIALDLAPALALAEDPDALVDLVALLLTGGELAPDSRALIVAHAADTALDAGNKPDGVQRVLEVLYLVS
ncbi:MAG TPA: DUF1800 domain-containing protein, partial [Planctomycetota bacterium]|nr:DUF1800 domain-containing protein [Planctomycetota bacterium]